MMPAWSKNKLLEIFAKLQFSLISKIPDNRKDTGNPIKTFLMNINQKNRSVEGLGYFLKIVTDRYKLIPSFASSTRLAFPKNRHQNIANIDKENVELDPKNVNFVKKFPILSELVTFKSESMKI
jgi:hypothetical protein